MSSASTDLFARKRRRQVSSQRPTAPLDESESVSLSTRVQRRKTEDSAAGDRACLSDSVSSRVLATEDSRVAVAAESVKEKRGFGPKKAPSNVRVTSRIDYQPDVCKDYKETGFCGYGDSCKFLHDRGDYKQGWQLERDWLAGHRQPGKVQMDKQDVEEKTQDAEDKTQDAEETCGICKKEFVDPVKLLCQHYFCQDCALKWMEKNANCARCGKPTRGILNAAREKKQQSRE